jgi:NifU-like protein involved in Fe-S cluster formation
MVDDLYNPKILDLAGNIQRLGRLPHPDASATAHSRLCGSTITVDVALSDDRVEDFAQEVKACALGQASASILARHVIGASIGELTEARDQLRQMLKENGPPPEGRFAELSFLEPVREYRARHASTMLAFEAVVDAATRAQAARETA